MLESRLMGGVRRALFITGAGFGVALLTAGVASAADPTQLRSRMGNWCLDGPNGKDTPVMINPCTGSKSQLWIFNSAGQLERITGVVSAALAMLAHCPGKARFSI